MMRGAKFNELTICQRSLCQVSIHQSFQIPQPSPEWDHGEKGNPMESCPREEDALEPLRSAAHDLRHSLFVLKTGIQLLSQVRESETKFNELRALLENEIQTASEHLKELLKLAAE
jgi:hypothetical protein